MDLNLNRKSQLPIHVQLKAQLTHLIQAGQLAPGVRLPTVRQLAGFCGLIGTRSQRSLPTSSARGTCPVNLGEARLCPERRPRQRRQARGCEHC